MTYSVKEIFYTLQGEGANVGKPAVFCRFAGCNLWSGLEKDRDQAICRFCDTDFVGVDGVGGGKFKSAIELASTVAKTWPDSTRGEKFVVLTGGEPTLQIDEKLVDALHAEGFRIAVETNGTIVPAKGIDWVCVSPKAGAPLAYETGQELKVVFPQPTLNMEELSGLDFQHFFIQPMDGADKVQNTASAIEYCQQNPHWRLSVQVHKILGIL